MDILNGKTAASKNIPLTDLTKPTTTTKIPATTKIPTRYSTLCEIDLPTKENHVPFEIEPTLPLEPTIATPTIPTLTEDNLPTPTKEKTSFETTLLLPNRDAKLTNPSDSEDDYSSACEEFVC